MALPVEKQWQFAQRVERELTAKLNEKDPLFEDIEHLIHQLRIACETTIFLNFDYATTQKVESHLWEAHILINNRYRKIVGRFKGEDRKKHVVEKRKWEKRYADFLKTSQFFYRSYIQRLASHFDCLSELQKIAHRLQLSTLSADDQIHVSKETNHRILLSCHATLLRLGDLSRYRNVLRNKDRSWVNALAYYSLANDLYPASGTAFNQMAVISLSEGNHLDAVYHLYRALAIEEPNPVAQGNLEIEFKKITSEWASGGKKTQPNGLGATTKAGNIAMPLVLWFVRLHAKLYKGEEFSEHDELENEVLSQMTVLLKEQSLEGILDKFVLINIAAENFAAERLQALGDREPSPELIQSYRFFLRLNIRMLFMLLQLLQLELAGSGSENDVPDVTGRAQQTSTEIITAVTRRILPALRQYSTWLVLRAEVISGHEGNTAISVHIKEMWSLYCSTISLLVVAFPPENLPRVEYLLEEDAETVGFKPFRNSEFCDLYTTDGVLKARFTDLGIERNHPNIEMLARVRDLLRDAMILTVNTDKEEKKIAPIVLVGTEFRFLEDGLPLSSPIISQHYQYIASSDDLQPNNVPKTMGPIQPYVEERAPSVAPSDSHQSMTTDMYRMVDDLVAPPSELKRSSMEPSDDTSYGMHSLTANEVFASIDPSRRPASRHQPSPTSFPSLPGIYNSPFSPQPGELSATSPDRPSTAILLSTLQLEDRQLTEDAAPFEETTTYGTRQFSPWGTEIPPSQSLASVSPQHNVGQALHQSLAQQYSISSTFSNASSLYPSTPRLNSNRRYGGIPMSRNDSATYASTSDFNQAAILHSSIWNGSQQGWGGPVPTPPGGQGG